MNKKHTYRLIVAALIITLVFVSIAKQTMAESLSPDDPQSPSDDYISFMPLVVLGELLFPTPEPTPTPPTPGVTQTPVTPSPTTPAPTTPAPSSTPVPIPEGMILVDHRHIDLFDQIPPQYLEAAKNIRMLFSDRSVGENISWGLDCLAVNEYGDSAPGCRKEYIEKEGSTWDSALFTQDDFNNGTVPDTIYFDPDASTYDRSNWTYEFRMGTWEELTQDYVTNLVPAYVNSKDVLSYQFSYLNIMEGDTIADPQIGFFAADPGNANRYDISDIEALEAQYPNKIFVYWTTSLARSIGTIEGEQFNNQMRQYAIDNQKILFDVADIEAHDPNGAACYDNRDGVEFCGTNGCENYPDDGLNIPAICQDYTSEIGGGHLGQVSGGKIRIAKAFWVLMAQIAGWDPTQQ